MGSAYQDAVGEDLYVVQEKSYMGKQVFSTGKAGCFYKVIDKRIYIIIQVTAKAPDFKSFRDCAIVC